jgi:hypothetical protein
MTVFVTAYLWGRIFELCTDHVEQLKETAMNEDTGRKEGLEWNGVGLWTGCVKGYMETKPHGQMGL